MIRLGYKASAEQFSPNDLIEYTVLAEESGFDSVFISDHLQPWRHTDGHAPAALPWLGAAAMSTERVILGTSVLTPTFRYHPGTVAQAFATLGCLAPGRVILGVGSGESMNEAPLGLPWPPAKERFYRLKEAVQLIQALWSEDRVDFDGAYYQARNATIYDKPDVPVPIYMAASGPSATTLAGRLGDGFITTSGKGMSLYQDTLLPALTKGVEKSGRALSDIDLMIEVKVSFNTNLKDAAEATKHWGALALSGEEKTGIEDPMEMERRADALPLERTVSRWIVSDDPEEHVERIREYIEMGFTHLVFHDPRPDQESFLRTYASEVLPRLRQFTEPVR